MTVALSNLDDSGSSRAVDISQLWPRPVPVSGEPRPPETRVLIVESTTWFRLHNIPEERTISDVLAVRPDAAALLAEWAEIWRRSFPSAHVDGWISTLNEDTTLDREERLRALETQEAILLRDGDHEGAARHAVWRDTVLASEGMRDWRMHVVDDAASVVSLRRAEPGRAFLSLDGRMIGLVGHHADGLPILRRIVASGDHHAVVKAMGEIGRAGDDIPYWTAPAFLRNAGRSFAVCRDRRGLAVVLTAMGAKGHAKAFLKGVDSKSGTWTVPLRDDGDPIETMVAVARAMGAVAFPSKGVIVQEHVPFEFEQRFFVSGGRIVSSVCSDRNHCAIDGSRRRLDGRVARLRVPEIDDGAYDRGVTGTVTDRVLSARFAREARRIVRELRDDGYRNYVIDMGWSDRGVLPIELNSLFLSGPYGLDRTRQIAAARRAGMRLEDELRGLIGGRATALELDPAQIASTTDALVARCRDLHVAYELTSSGMKAAPLPAARSYPRRLSQPFDRIDAEILAMAGRRRTSVARCRNTWFLPVDPLASGAGKDVGLTLLPPRTRVAALGRYTGTHRYGLSLAAMRSETVILIAPILHGPGHDEGVSYARAPSPEESEYLGLRAATWSGVVRDDRPVRVLDRPNEVKPLPAVELVATTTEGRRSIALIGLWEEHVEEKLFLLQNVDPKIPIVLRDVDPGIPIVLSRLVVGDDGRFAFLDARTHATADR